MYATFMAQAEKDGLRDSKTSFQYATDSELQHKQLFEKGFNLLGPKNVDYFVDVKSGDTVEVRPGDTPPVSKLIDGAYVKAANWECITMVWLSLVGWAYFGIFSFDD